MFSLCTATASSAFASVAWLRAPAAPAPARRMRRHHRRHEPGVRALEQRVGLRIRVGAVLDRVDAGAQRRRLMPSAPWACAAALRPNRCAVSTMAFISSSNICWLSPPAMLLFTPPVAVNLITSAPCEICSRTARRQSSAPLQGWWRATARSSAMSRLALLAASAWPPVIEIPEPAATIVGPAIRPDAMASRSAVTLWTSEPKVAHGREAGLERPARVVDADQQVVLDVAVVGFEPRAHLVVVVEDVHVRVDEPRQDELLARSISRAPARGGDVAVANRLDPAAADDDRGSPATPALRRSGSCQ